MPWTIRRIERRVSPQRRRAERRVGSRPGSAARIRVLVVEDNRLMRDGLARLLAEYSDVDIVASAESANAATQLLPDAKPHVVLLDGALADADSYHFLDKLKASAPDAKAVVMDFVPAQQDVTRFSDGGANGFILKDATAEDVVNAIRTVASGTDLPPPPAPPRNAIDGGGTRVGRGGGGHGGHGGHGAHGGHAAPVTSVGVRLTKREQEIKTLIAAGLGNKEIAQRLNITTNTVKSHVHNMLGKLAALMPPDRRQGNRSRRSGSRRSYRLTR